ncbi:MAG: tetratricopeptide repeat protein, partial [Pseudomonadota bacterium]|nr:tetratricopeptide repeat protein [Pseudomonadota bacterium]
MNAGETPQMLLERAARLREAGRTVEAIEAYQQALALRPDEPNSWYNLAWLQRRARRFEAALASYAEALARGVADPEEVHLNRAVILADHLAQPDAALAELRSALGLNPNYVPALLNLGNLHEDRGERDEARAAYARALALSPGDPLALARLAGVS